MSFATFQSHFDTVNLASQNDLSTHASHLEHAQLHLDQGEHTLTGEIKDIGTSINETAYLATSAAWDALDAGLQAGVKMTGLDLG